ncbi:DIT2 [Candida oxycetoniae]|uniref:DIT2 n=1 Tax=Candida oxycetoniae TaxID=497107 RepID=A0AAI9SZN5_9ASCO|nr:DIT2 [Candida oxycetoniae]KAI3405914.2 DIT2 [Candida oxycetoniae]
MVFLLILALLSIVIITFIGPIVVPPFSFPRNIPTIPFYVSFLGLDQLQLYEKYLREKLEKYGAVKIYFASRWNILVSKPEYLVHIFKNEDIFAKSGNHIKIPKSVLATYTGDNIISAHGDLWRLYRDVVAQSIQFPDLVPIEKNTRDFLKSLEKELQKGPSIFVNDLLQLYSLANVGDCIVGANLTPMHQKIKYIKSQIFKPFFMNFPSVEMFPIPSRIKAKKEVEAFRSWYGEKIKNSTRGAAANLSAALSNGKLTQKQYLDNSIILMVAGHENPLLLMLSLLYVLAKNSCIQEKVRKEGDPYLSAVVYETLRMYPPLNQIINRCTTQATILGNIYIPKGVYVGYYNMGTGRDANFWESANEFKPERWGSTSEEISANYSKAKRMGTLPAFHGRKRACLGEKFALYECKMFVQAVLGKYKISLDDTWKERITPAGPICPVNMKLRFSNL